MKVNSIPNQNNTAKRQNFGWVRVCSSNVVRHAINEKEFLPVDVCVLTKDDVAFIKTLQEKWKKRINFRYDIIQEFLSNVKKTKKFPKLNNQNGAMYLMVIPRQPLEIFPRQTIFQKTKSLLNNIFNRKERSPKKTITIENEPLCIARLRLTDGETAKNLTTVEEIQESPKILNQATKNRISGSLSSLLYGAEKINTSIEDCSLSLPLYYKKVAQSLLGKDVEPVQTCALGGKDSYLVQNPKVFRKTIAEKLNLKDANEPLSAEHSEEILKHRLLTEDLFSLYEEAFKDFFTIKL